MAVANLAAAVSARADQLSQSMPGGLGLSGSGVTVGIWDQAAALSSHEDLAGRAFAVDRAGAADHSTHVAGTIAGSGASQAAARGIAPEALLLAHDWSLDEIELRQAAPFLSVSAHAYGSRMGWASNPTCSALPSWLGHGGDDEDRAFGKYGAEARAIDAIAYSTGALTVWAAGNERQDVGASGEPHFHFPDCASTHTDAHVAEVEDGYDTLGLQLAAKNTLVVGASAHIDSPPAEPAEIAVLAFSSFGPLDDGRIKPDVIASGALIYSATSAADDAHASYSGTSSSAAVVAGSIALLTEHQRNLNHGIDLPAEAMRALLLHSAVSLSDDGGPSYAAGYGLLDAKRAADVITADAAQRDGWRQIALGSVADDASFEVHTDVIASGTRFRVSLAWTDPPGAIHDGGIDDPTPALVNDLDLELIAPDGRTVRYPWSLDAARPAAAATRSKANRADNAEVVDVTPAMTTEAGVWTIRVAAHGALYRGRSQRMALVADVPFTEPAQQLLEAPRTVVIEVERGAGPVDEVIELRKARGDPLAIEARADAPWLTVVGDDITAPGSFTLRAESAELKAGLHYATVELVHDGEGTERIGVVLRVTCEPDCTGRTCGLDPVCGSSCGSCGAGEYCAEDNSCASWTAGCPAADLGSAPAQLAAHGSTQGAGDDSEGSCGGLGAEDVAFAWTAPEAGRYRIATDGSALHTVLYVRDGCDGTELACEADAGGASSALSIELDAQQAIVIIVDGSDAAGDFHLSIERALCPDADIGSKLGTSIAAGSTTGGTDRIAGSCGDSGHRDVTFSWTAPSSAQYMFSTLASDHPHTIYVRSGDCEGAELSCSSAGDYEVALDLTQGERVVATVEATGANGGRFTLGVTSSKGLCAGNCDGTPNDGECFCDPACVEEGDCCADACSVCGSCCVPDCDGRACGDDGCGGSCGSCEDDERCDTGECIPDPCVGAESGAACDDGDPCTTDDRCIGGRCSGVAAPCAPDSSVVDGAVDAGEELAGGGDTDDAGDASAARPASRPAADCGCSVASSRPTRAPIILMVFACFIASTRRMRSKRNTLRTILTAFALLWLLGCDGAPDDSTDKSPGGRGGESGEGGGGVDERPDDPIDEQPPDEPERDAGAEAADEDAGPDAPSSCGSGECDLLDPLSCEDGFACVLTIDETSDEPRALCDEAGPGLDGDACDSPADCGPGLDCTSFDENGACRRYCCSLNTTAGCPSGQFCRVALEDMSSATGVALCDRCDGCDVADADSCGQDRGCYPVGANCSACLRAGKKRVGESCALADECEPGSACFSVNDELRCVRFCVRPDGQCPDTTSCEPAEQLIDGIGLCL